MSIIILFIVTANMHCTESTSDMKGSTSTYKFPISPYNDFSGDTVYKQACSSNSLLCNSFLARAYHLQIEFSNLLVKENICNSKCWAERAVSIDFFLYS